ncbi:hypothetical protein PVK06_048076 [Gossypium arboreum]|uniref:Uncharacterized protein n=1 Tax=Gossypium arboreum TaxID=29729 RepID=A0ABR0MGY2_GOSAR|nr:hypothetical protein PVK06_048076 [Gossypium arboreum]
MIISESFQVGAIIEKFPTWNHFKNYLKYKRKELSVKDLIVRLQIEEDNKGMKKRLNKAANDNVARVNVVEVKKDFKKGKKLQNGSKLGPKVGVPKKKTFPRKSSNYRIQKKVRANETNFVEEISKEVSDMKLCA